MTNLGTEGQILFDANKKSKLVAYLLWFFLGVFAAHRFYLRQYRSAAMQLSLWIAALVLYFMALKPLFELAAANPEAATGDPETLAQNPAVQAAAEQVFTSPMFYGCVAVGAVATIWWIVDAFLIPGLVRRHNDELARGLAGR